MTADPYPCTLHGGALVRRTPTGFRAEGGPVPPDWKLAYYHGVWHATKGARHLTHASLGECLRLAKQER